MAKLWPISTFPNYHFFTLATLLLIGGSALADSYRVHYSIAGKRARQPFKPNQAPKHGAQSWRCSPAQW